MYMEDEASKKLCCDGDAESRNCEASECMAWRWASETDIIDTPVGNIHVERNPQTHGYCGLAGKP